MLGGCSSENVFPQLGGEGVSTFMSSFSFLYRTMHMLGTTHWLATLPE